MTDERHQVTIWLASDDPTERERLEDSLQALAAELREVTGVDSVDRLPGAPPPPGTRAGLVLAGVALVAMVGVYGVVPLVNVLRTWIRVNKNKTLSVAVSKGEVLRLAMRGYGPRRSIHELERLHIYGEDLGPIDLDDAPRG
jgi:hypothetical protein